MQAEQRFPCLPSLGERCGNCHRCEPLTWEDCCDHCGCKPDMRLGHDDTCCYGCNDKKGDYQS